VLWVWIAAGFGAGALLGAAVPGAWPDWQPGRFAAEPWRAFSAALAHGSPTHLAANLAGAALVAAYGWAAGATRGLALAWLAAWPLTQVGLLLRPALAHYVGLSGVLHAGVAAVTVQLLWRGDRRQRTVGAAVAVGVLAKLALEQPWGPLLHPAGALGVAVAPLAHATGTLAGTACALLALAAAPRCGNA
jgi:rhomboid family GlyGly-CTERM serine protease